jgi:hypothetical protein
MNDLVDEGFIILGGPLEDSPDVLLVMRATTGDEIVERLAVDPWTQQGLSVIKQIWPWQIRLGALV